MSARLNTELGRKPWLTPIGEINGSSIYPHCGAEGDADDDSDADDSGDSGDDQSDKDDDDDDGNDAAAKDDKDKKSRQRKRSSSDQDDSGSSVINSLRKDLRAAKKDLAALRDEKRKADLADKSEVERTTVERDDAAKRAEKAEERLQHTLTELEIIKISAQKKYGWADLEDVINDRKLRAAIEIDDDGEIHGVEDALKDLAKRKPHFLAKSSDDKDDKGKGGGTKTGADFNSGGNNNDRKADRDRLLKNYPVLGRMQDG